MELYQLKTFVTVAEEGLLTGAAERLHSSQPAISAHIKALESELGLALFDRTPKGMRLTAEGEELKIKALAILDAASDLSHTAETLKGTPSGDVRLGLHTDPVLLRITDIFTEFQQAYPKLSVNYQQKMSWQASRELTLGNLDAAFMFSRPDDKTIEVQTLEQIQLVIVAPAAWQDRVWNSGLVGLLSFPWVWTDQRCPLYTVSVDLFSQTGQEPAKAVIVDQESTILKMVSAGVGLSLMPEARARESARAGQIYISKLPAPKIDLSLIYLKSLEHDPVVRAIVDVVNLVWRTKALEKQSKIVQLNKQIN